MQIAPKKSMGKPSVVISEYALSELESNYLGPKACVFLGKA